MTETKMKRSKAASATQAKKRNPTPKRTANKKANKRANGEKRSKNFEKIAVSVMESAVFELPPMESLFTETWNEFARAVDGVLRSASRSTEFEIIHALMVHFYNRRPVGQKLEPTSSKISALIARNIERRMRFALGKSPSYKTIFDNFALAPKDAQRIARRLQRRQFMMAFFAQSCGAWDPARNPPISHQELERVRQSLDEWGLNLSTNDVEHHLTRAHKTLVDETSAKARSRRV